MASNWLTVLSAGTRWFAPAIVIGMTVIAAFGGGTLAKWMRQPTHAIAVPTGVLPADLERWDRPDLTLLITGQQHGYLLPCGCSRPQVGGLERRYNFFQALSSRGWKTLPVDLGDISQMAGPVNLSNMQGLMKYRYSMQALKMLGYAAVGLGEYEGALPFFKALGEYALNEPSPRVIVANLNDADTQYPEQTARWQAANVEGSYHVGDWPVGGIQNQGPSGAPWFQQAGPRKREDGNG